MDDKDGERATFTVFGTEFDNHLAINGGGQGDGAAIVIVVRHETAGLIECAVPCGIDPVVTGLSGQYPNDGV